MNYVILSGEIRPLLITQVYDNGLVAQCRVLRQGDVEKSPLITSNLMLTNKVFMLSMVSLYRSDYIKLTEIPVTTNGVNRSEGRYRLDIGETPSQDRAISIHA